MGMATKSQLLEDAVLGGDLQSGHKNADEDLDDEKQEKLPVDLEAPFGFVLHEEVVLFGIDV